MSHAFLVIRMRVSSRRRISSPAVTDHGGRGRWYAPPFKALVDELVYYTIASINISSVFEGPNAISVVFTNISQTGSYS